jgi:hypothetical protein
VLTNANEHAAVGEHLNERERAGVPFLFGLLGYLVAQLLGELALGLAQRQPGSPPARCAQRTAANRPVERRSGSAWRPGLRH